jgi:hypothetical protein
VAIDDIFVEFLKVRQLLPLLIFMIFPIMAVADILVDILKEA